MHLKSQIAEYFHGQGVRFLKPSSLKQTVKACKDRNPILRDLSEKAFWGQRTECFMELRGALWGSTELRGAHSPAFLLWFRQQTLVKVRMNSSEDGLWQSCVRSSSAKPTPQKPADRQAALSGLACVAFRVSQNFSLDTVVHSFLFSTPVFVYCVSTIIFSVISVVALPLLPRCLSAAFFYKFRSVLSKFCSTVLRWR